ncbi:hypothetical protein C8J57DRAFT_1629052 [Mycena rebaudengoi]|nr:hypothetical protein C8J57DRAFT_1629052 [Mycena rebaudengoi]
MFRLTTCLNGNLRLDANCLNNRDMVTARRTRQFAHAKQVIRAKFKLRYRGTPIDQANRKSLVPLGAACLASHMWSGRPATRGRPGPARRCRGYPASEHKAFPKHSTYDETGKRVKIRFTASLVTIYGFPRETVPKPNTNFRHSPASFFLDNVRHVQLVGVPIAEILIALAACNATINLALFDVSCVKGDAALLEFLGEFPLKRLSARENYWLCPGGWDFGHPLFAHITHLDLPGNPNHQWAKWSPLALIPRLTHLSFSEDFLNNRSIFSAILEHCKSLQVLAMVFPYLAMLKYVVLALELQPSSFDPRVVFLAVADRQADWETEGRGGDDYWIAAERLVEKHRTGDFDGTFPRSALSTLTDHFAQSDFAPGDFGEDEAKELSRESFFQIA